MTRVKKVCGTCGGDDVCRDADVIWSITTQTWELDPNSDCTGAGYCRDCVTEVEIVDAPATLDSSAYDARMKPLTDEYTAWLKENQLPEVSADEQNPEDLVIEQMEWLNDFIERWQKLEQGA